MWGLMAPKMSQLDFLCWPHQVFFFVLIYLYLSKEANGPNFKPKLLVRVPKVSHHHIHDWNLINLGSIDLHHSLSIALPRLQQERDIENGHSGKQTFLDILGSFLSVQMLSFRLAQEYTCCQVLWRHSGGQTHDPCRRDHVQTHLWVSTCRPPNKTSPLH